MIKLATEDRKKSLPWVVKNCLLCHVKKCLPCNVKRCLLYHVKNSLPCGCKITLPHTKQFFYWQRILRREAYEASQNPPLPVVAETEPLSAAQRTVSFAEIKLPAASPDASSIFHPDLVIRKGNLVLEISNSASAELLSRIGGILHAE